MGAINLDAVKKQVSEMLLAVQNLTQNNIPIPPVLTERLEKLQKQLAGNNSQQMAEYLHGTVGKLFLIEKNHDIVANIAKLAGDTGVKVKISVSQNESAVNGYEVKFEAAGSGGTSGGPSTGGTVGTKSPAKYNKYVITATEEAQNTYGYKPIETFQVGAKAKDYILNPTGKELSVDEKKSVATLNPMGRVFDFGKAASANSTLEGLAKDENFKKHLKIEMSKVEETPAE